MFFEPSKPEDQVCGVAKDPTSLSRFEKSGTFSAPKWALAALAPPSPPVLEFESAALGFKGEQSALCSALFVNVQNMKLHYTITLVPRGGAYMVECSMKQSLVEL
jgi:hypothetical protein